MKLCWVFVLVGVLVGLAPRLLAHLNLRQWLSEHIDPRLVVQGVIQLVLWTNPLPQYRDSHLREAGGQPVRYLEEDVDNWAGNTHLGPVTVFYPRTVAGVQEVVRMVKVTKNHMYLKIPNNAGVWKLTLLFSYFILF